MKVQSGRDVRVSAVVEMAAVVDAAAVAVADVAETMLSYFGYTWTE